MQCMIWGTSCFLILYVCMDYGVSRITCRIYWRAMEDHISRTLGIGQELTNFMTMKLEYHELMYIYIYNYKYAYTHIDITYTCSAAHGDYTYIYIAVYCMCVSIYIYVYMHTCMQAQ